MDDQNDLSEQLEGLFAGLEPFEDAESDRTSSALLDELLSARPAAAESGTLLRIVGGSRQGIGRLGDSAVARAVRFMINTPRLQRRVTLVAAATALTFAGMILGIGLLSHPIAEPPSANAMVLPSPSPQSPTPPPSPTPTDSPSPTPTRIPAPSATSLPTHTPSPTPTSTPVPPATVIVPAPFPTLEVFPTMPVTSPLPIPTPVPPISTTADTLNILVLGSDRREDWTEWHTDAIQLVSIQTDRAAVSILSIPRDLYVYIPGLWMSRINFADYYGESRGHEGGGAGLLRDTILYNLGLKIDYTVRTDFDGLIGIVDTLGGIDIPVHCRLEDHWPYPDEQGEYPILTLEPAVHHMDGETALWYARSRQTTSIFSRDRRQQQVLQAIYHQMRNTGTLTRIPALWDQLREMVETDMGIYTVLQMGQVGLSLRDSNLRTYNIGFDMVEPWTTPQGGNVFLPNWDEIEPVLTEMMAPVPDERLTRTFAAVEIWNRTDNDQADLLAADRLASAGFPAQIGPSDWRVFPDSRLVVYSEYGKGTGVGHLQTMFRIPDSRVTFEPEESSPYGFRLILGADYDPCR